MKKLMIGIISLFVIIIGGFLFFKYNPFTNEVNTLNIYTKADKLTKNELFKNDIGTEIYYFYQKDCANCNSIKSSIVSSYNKLINSKNTNFYLVDMSDEKNQSLWYDWNKHNQDYPGSQNPTDNPNYKFTPDKINDINNLSIVGTPTLVVRQNGKTIQYRVGSDEVLDILNYIIGTEKEDKHSHTEI